MFDLTPDEWVAIRLSLRIAIPLGKLPEMLKSLNIEADDKGEPGEKHRVRLQLKVGGDKEAKALEAKNKELQEKEKQNREKQ